MFVIQGKKFIILTQMYYNDDFKINGLTMLLRDYFSAIG